MRIICAHMRFLGPKINNNNNDKGKRWISTTLVLWHAVKLLVDKNSFNTHKRRHTHTHTLLERLTTKSNPIWIWNKMISEWTRKRHCCLLLFLTQKNYSIWIFMSTEHFCFISFCPVHFCHKNLVYEIFEFLSATTLDTVLMSDTKSSLGAQEEN